MWLHWEANALCSLLFCSSWRLWTKCAPTSLASTTSERVTAASSCTPLRFLTTRESTKSVGSVVALHATLDWGGASCWFLSLPFCLLPTRWTWVSVHGRFPWQRGAGPRAATAADAVHVPGVSVGQPAHAPPGGRNQDSPGAVSQPGWLWESVWGGKFRTLPLACETLKAPQHLLARWLTSG